MIAIGWFKLRDHSLPPTPQQETPFTQQTAQTISRWGLTLPALFILGAGQPLTFLAAQCLWVANPALSLFLPKQQLHQLALSLESPADVQQMIQHLEKEPLS
ncbi:MAG: hypothetical protein AAF614_17055 [Chloroflexota bacterium]